MPASAVRAAVSGSPVASTRTSSGNSGRIAASAAITRLPDSSAASAFADRVADRQLVAREARANEPLAGAVDVEVGERADAQTLEAAIAGGEGDSELTHADDAGADAPRRSGANSD